MKLSDYIKTPADRAALADKLGVTIEAVRMWEAGKRFPRHQHRVAIEGATNGKVRARDLMDAMA